MNKKIILIAIIVIIILILGGWFLLDKNQDTSKETTEEEQIQGDRQQVEVKKGETFQVILAANPTTGYQWQVDFDSDFVELSNRAYAPGSDLVGAGGQEAFVFLAKKQGSIDITFSYIRPWENVQPIAKEIYELTIKEPDSFSGESTIEGWKSFRVEGVGFQMDHPAEMIVRNTGGQINFSVWGSTQTEGTELFDGISLTILRSPYEQETLREAVEAQRQSDLSLGISSIDEVEEYILSGMTGYYYVGEGLGIFTNIFIDLGGKEALVVSYSVPDPGNLGFQQTVNTMLSTLKLIK